MYAAATLDAVDALAERHAETTEDPTDFSAPVRMTVESTRRSLSRADPPAADASDEDVFGESLQRRDRQHLDRRARRAVNRWREQLSTPLTEGRLATGIHRAIRIERDRNALEAVIQRIRDDDIPELETIEPLRTEREAALDAAESVPVPASEASIAGDVVARTRQRLALLDDELQRDADREQPSRLDREYATYIHRRAQLEALPTAIETVRDRLDTWPTFDG